ncbi:collagenase-like [Aphomia sociella]
MWFLFVLFAVLDTSVLADSRLTYPEIARGDQRIVSGWEAVPGQLPFQLSLRMVSAIGGVSSCGGTIIHREWGLTAAHCTALRVSLVVRAGAVNLTQPVYIFETSEYYNHPLYIDALSVVQPNDIGVIKFGRELIFNDYVKPIRLHNSASMNRNYDGVRLTASGWGRTWTAGNSPENMNWVFLTGTSNAFCRSAYGGSSTVQDSTICASAYNVSSQSICQGDSGGPLTVVDDDGEISEVGVSSFVSSTGCHTDFPGGFIRPGHYHDWYYEVTGINFDWEYSPPTTTVTPESESEESEESSQESSSESSESDNDSIDSGSDSSESGNDSSDSDNDSSASGNDSSDSGNDSNDSGNSSDSSKYVQRLN